MNIEKEFATWMVSASRDDLDSAMLARMAESRNLRKRIDELVDLWLEETLRGELLAWIAAHREELVAKLRDAANPFRLPRRVSRPIRHRPCRRFR